MQPPSSHPPWQEQPGSLSPLWVSYCAWGQDPTHKLKTEPTKTGPDRQCFASPAPAMRIAIMPRTCTVRLHSPSCKTTGSKFNQVQKMVQILNMAGKEIALAKGVCWWGVYNILNYIVIRQWNGEIKKQYQKAYITGQKSHPSQDWFGAA